MSTNGHLKFQGTNRATFVGETSNIMFDTTTTSLGIGVTGTDHPSSNLYITGNAYISNSISVGGVLTMGTVNVVARHDLEAVTAMGNTTPLTIEFSNATTGIVTTGNVEVGNELTVAGNTALSSNLTVSGNVSDLNVVSNVNMLHTANTAALKLNSNVVAEFPRSKKLIKYPRVALTSASDNAYENGYKVTVSNEEGGHKAYDAFDGAKGANSVELWYSGTLSHYSTSDGSAVTSGTNIAPRLDTNTDYGEWIGIELPVAIKLQSFHLWQQYNDHNHFPQSSTLYAKRESSDPWAEIYRYDNRTRSLEPDRPEIFDDVDSERFYKHFALVCRRRVQGTNATTGVSLGEWELYGVPEYDPEAHGVDVKVTSYPNVPNTDWLEVYYDAKDLADGAVTSVSDLKPSSLGTALNSSSTNNITVSGNAFVFNGTDSYIKIDDLTNPSGAWTHSVVAWINSSDLGNFDLTWIGDVDSATTRQSFSFHTSGQALTMGISASNVQFHFSSPLVKDKWHHVVYTFNGGAAGSGSTAYKVFVDGVEGYKTGGVGSGTLNLPAQTAIWIGRNHGGSNYFNGKIANFRLFNRALSQDEIYQLYTYQKEYFGHGDLSMTLKAGRLGIGTSEPRAALDVRGSLNFGIPNVHSDSLSGYGSITAASEEAGYAPLGNDMYVVWGNHAIAHTGSGQYNWTWYFPNDFTMTVLSAVGTLRDCGYGYSFDRSGLGINAYYTNRIAGHTKNDTIGSFTQHIHFVIIGKRV